MVIGAAKSLSGARAEALADADWSAGLAEAALLDHLASAPLRQLVARQLPDGVLLLGGRRPDRAARRSDPGPRDVDMGDPERRDLRRCDARGSPWRDRQCRRRVRDGAR